METEKSMKIMVTGAGGFVGSRLTAYYGEKYDVWGVTHKDLDLTDEAAVIFHCFEYRCLIRQIQVFVGYAPRAHCSPAV